MERRYKVPGVDAKADSRQTGHAMRNALLPTFATTLLAMLLLTGSPALAAFKVCNKTALPVRAAIGRFDGTHWSSQGWWTVAAKQCVDLLTGPLQARYYYLYASDGGAGTWDGKFHFCAAPAKSFKAEGRADCAKRGFDIRGFFQIDTGRNPDWVQNLSN
jgi:uncharacterized membrane protein